MSAKFIIPDWMLPAEPEPVEVDPHRVESLVNRFIAAKQDALFTAPDAYYRTTGTDAVDGAPDILPEVYVVGGDSAKIERQMRNQGLDVRPAGAPGRLRIGGPPN